MHKPEFILEIETYKVLLDFEMQKDHFISIRRQYLEIIKKQQNLQIVDFAVLTDHRVKIKDNEKKDKYIDLARVLKKLRNLKVTVIPIITGALGMIPTGLVKGLKSRKLENVSIPFRLQHC